MHKPYTPEDWQPEDFEILPLELLITAGQAANAAWLAANPGPYKSRAAAAEHSAAIRDAIARAK